MVETLKTQIQNEFMQHRDAGSKLFVLVDPSRNPGLLTIAQGMTDEGACLRSTCRSRYCRRRGGTRRWRIDDRLATLLVLPPEALRRPVVFV